MEHIKILHLRCYSPFLSHKTCQPSSFWQDSHAFLPDVPHPAQSQKCPTTSSCTNAEKKPLRIYHRSLNAVLACPNVNAIEHDLGTSVRFPMKNNMCVTISRRSPIFWDAIYSHTLYSCKKFSSRGWQVCDIYLHRGHSSVT